MKEEIFLLKEENLSLRMSISDIETGWQTGIVE
jgi:hypothetical protein